MKHSKNAGYVLLEVMMALVILLCGILGVTDSYRYTLRAERESNERYRAALLLEGRVLELEQAASFNPAAEVDPQLGSLSWNDRVLETTTPGEQEHQVSLKWGEGKHSHAIELETWIYAH